MATDKAEVSGWKPGPLPAGTYHWGGVVLKGEEGGNRFRLADFCGDHVVLAHDQRKVQADEVAYFNNGIGPPPV